MAQPWARAWARGRGWISRYLDYYKQGRLNLDDMVSNRIRLNDINSALDALKEGQSVKSVVLQD